MYTIAAVRRAVVRVPTRDIRPVRLQVRQRRHHHAAIAAVPAVRHAAVACRLAEAVFRVAEAADTAAEVAEATREVAVADAGDCFMREYYKY